MSAAALIGCAGPAREEVLVAEGDEEEEVKGKPDSMKCNAAKKYTKSEPKEITNDEKHNIII